MFELQTVLEERRSTLDTLMTELLVSEIIEKEEIYFDSTTLLNETLCQAFLSRFDKYYGVFIYKIKLANSNDISKVKESFKNFQQLNKVLADSDKCNLSKFNNTDSDVLYVGIKSHKLKIRIKQHLGVGPSKSWALHLNHWIPQGINFKMTIYQVDSENTEFVNFLEQGFWDRLNPMFGRRKEV